MQTDEHVASEWLEATLETLYANFKEGRGVTLKGFGGFYVQPKGRTWLSDRNRIILVVKQI